MTPRKRTALIGLVVLALLWTASVLLVRKQLEQHVLTSGPNGPQTPASFGAPFEHALIPSGPRRLDSNIVTAPATCPDAPAVLLFHGMRETISEWARTQAFLASHCVSSVVFDPPGNGATRGPAHLSTMIDDAVAAYVFTAQHFPQRRLYVLGHSLGNARMLQAVPYFPTPPSGVIEANGFSSLRSAAGHHKSHAFRLFLRLMPDWWNNVAAVRKIHSPLLVIVSDTDHSMPSTNGERIFAAANEPKRLVHLHGFDHNALSLDPTEAWWSQALSFLHAQP